MSTRMFLRFLGGLLPAVLILGCTGSPPLGVGSGEVALLESDRWLDMPDLVEYPAAVGVAPVLAPGHEAHARREAEADGRAKLAAALQSDIRQMFEGMSLANADLMEASTAAALINSSQALRQFVDLTISGVRPLAYRQRKRSLYVLMAFKDIGGMLDGLKQASRAELLRLEALHQNQELKERLFQKMDEYAETRRRTLQERLDQLRSSADSSGEAADDTASGDR